uniref:Pentacotripeptide-repeat region of PRORP domain-containing protein n=1 Tax=Leersia perrieri TaxID=77586 RepID=A0A0D9W7S5_9ORYZ
MLLHILTSSSLAPARPTPLRQSCAGAGAAFTVRCASSSSSSTPPPHSSSSSAAAAAAGKQVAMVHGYGTVDYERRAAMRWSSLYRRIAVGHGGRPVGRTLVAWDEGERRLDKWELCRIARELRKFRRFNLALQVYDWMTERRDRFSLSSSDMAIQLDLIAKVRGVSHAEEYFEELPDPLKDKRTYGSLLNVYAQAMMKEKTESTFEQMRKKGFATDTLPFNVLMNFYVDFGETEKVSLLIDEMMERNVAFDVCTYNIWIKSCAAMQDTDGMEEVFNQMIRDETVVANWTTYTTLASMYIKLGNFEKAEESLKEAEKRTTGRDKKCFHFLMTLYSHLGKKEEVFRIWNWYKATFPTIHNLGYQEVLSALVRLGDIEGAELLYDEWASKSSSFDPKTMNILLAWYAREGFVTKAEQTVNRFVEKGGNPKPNTWEILGTAYLKDGQLSEALSCLEKAAAVTSASKWRPRPTNVESLLANFKEKNDTESADRLMNVLKSRGCEENEEYKSLFNTYAFQAT